MLRLDGKVVLITGLGQADSESGVWGIGAAIAVLFARQGWKVFGGNRSLESAIVMKNRMRRKEAFVM